MHFYTSDEERKKVDNDFWEDKVVKKALMTGVQREKIKN